MSNKVLVEKEVNNIGFELGNYDNKLEGLTKKQLQKVLEQLYLEFTDVEVSMNRKKHIVEIETVDNEKDLYVLSKEEYFAKYGDNK